jgi:hypothetical protein
MQSWKYFIPASWFLPPYFAALGNHLLGSGNPTKTVQKNHELHIVRIQVLPALHHAHLNTMDAWHPFYKFNFFENYIIFIITIPSTTPNGWQKKVGFMIHYTYQENVYWNMTTTDVNVETGY